MVWKDSYYMLHNKEPIKQIFNSADKNRIFVKASYPGEQD